LTADANAKDEDGNNRQPGATGTRGALGVTVEPLRADVAAELGLNRNAKGVVVTDVDPSGPAAEVGLQREDVILEVNHTPVTSGAEIRTAIQNNPNRPALLLVSRGGRNLFVAVKPNGAEDGRQ